MRTVTEVRILFIDDDPAILNSLRRFLRKEEYQQYFAASGQEALDLMARQPIDIIVTDLRMPAMTGFELIVEVKRRYPSILRLILSATSDIGQTIELINSAEVFRFITKPLEPQPFKKILMEAVDHYILKTEYEGLLKELETRNRDLQRTNASLQNLSGVLQSTPPTNLEGMKIAALTFPSGHLAGDFTDFVSNGRNIVDVVIGDVMGKGVAAAMMASGLKSHLLKVLAQHDCSIKPRMTCPVDEVNLERLGEVISALHTVVVPQLLALQMFAALCYARFHLQQKKMAYVSCGPTQTVHYQAAAHYCRYLPGKNPPLGMTEEPLYQASIVDFLPGDIFLFYTDGVTEAEGEGEEQFGLERLGDVICKNYQQEPEQLIATIADAVRNFTGEASFRDDFTCIVVKLDSQE